MQRQIFFTLLVIALSIVLIACQKSGTTPPVSGELALVNGTLIDGTGADPVTEAVVVIEDGLITAVGSPDKVEILAGVKLIDVQGATILPGFINAHIHSGYNEYNLKTWAQSGVTTVRDVGADPKRSLFTIRDNLLKDNKNARLVAAGPMLTAPKGYPKAIFNSPAAFFLTSPEDARQKVGQLLDDGADILKLTIESGTLWNRTLPIPSPETAAEVVKIAHEWDTKVTVHITLAQDLTRALDAGVDDIAHIVVDNVSAEQIRRMVNDNVYWVPTLELWKCVGYGLEDIAIDNLRRFVNAGGKVALGTDYDGYSCRFDLGMPLTEIEGMLQAGMTPMQIIVAATQNAAYVCNLENEIGTIQPGKLADILVVNGNPLEDINALLNVRMVIHNGEIIRGRD